MKGSRILVVEDDEDIVLVLQVHLESLGARVEAVGDVEGAVRLAREEEWDLVLLDHMLEDTEGLEVLKALQELDPELPVIYMTAFSTVSLAVNAMKMGVFDYVTKPFNLDELTMVVAKALEITSLRRELRVIRNNTRDAYGFEKVIGSGPKMAKVLEICRTVARSEASSVLITGESGVGKNLVAQAIHYNSKRAAKPFLTITCTALPEQLLESELFGHERGAFTDAKTAKRGLFEMGNGGTIFLDEIGDLPLSLQAKLLGVLEARKIRRVGGTKDIDIDARIIAATNQDLKKSIEEKRFRGDLFYRINVIQVEIPPLKERVNDVPLLAMHFIDHYNQTFSKSVQGLSPEAEKAMRAYDWPGNVREMKNVIERAMILGRGPLLEIGDLPAELRGDQTLATGDGSFILPPGGIQLQEVENDLIRQALVMAEGNQTQAARLLGLSRDQLRYRIKAHGVDV